MKKLVSIFLVLTLVLFCGCEKKQENNNKLNIVVTNFPSYDFARAVAGERADITMLIKPGQESHTFDPTPKEIALISEADLFIYVGSESENWVQRVIDSVEIDEERIFSLFSVISPEGDMEEHDHEQELDEHIWTSPYNASVLTISIGDKLAQIDPENGEEYKNNALRYSDALIDLDMEIQNVVSGANKKTLIFADRFPARYFTERYSLEYYSAVSGCSADAQPSSKAILELCERVETEKISAVFYIEFSNQKTADTICEKTGAKKLLFHSCHNISAEDFENGVTYIDLMKTNVKNIEEALK